MHIAVHINGTGVNGVHAVKLLKKNWQSGPSAGEQETCLRCGIPFDPTYRHRCALRAFDLSDLSVLAHRSCALCGGTGVRRWKRPSAASVRAYLGLFRGFRPEPLKGLIDQSKAAPLPCRCALRKVFLDCLRKHQQFSVLRDPGAGVYLFASPRTDRYTLYWWRKKESYLADFCLIAKRELHRRTLMIGHPHKGNPAYDASNEWPLFRQYCLGDVDRESCQEALGVSRGNFNHTLYRVQENVGRALYETQPYSLRPPANY